MASSRINAISNYFQVKDLVEFKKWVASIPDLEWLTLAGQRTEEMTAKQQHYLLHSFCIYSNVPGEGGWPVVSASTEQRPEVALADALAPHLVKGQVAILVEKGDKESRYPIGSAVSVDSTGKVIKITYDDIYEKAKVEFGHMPTDAAY